MKLQAANSRVKTGKKEEHPQVATHRGAPQDPPAGFVDLACILPEEEWEKVKEHSREEGITVDEVIAYALEDYFAGRKAAAAANRELAEGLGVTVSDLVGLCSKPAQAAVKEIFDRDGEVAFPLTLCAVPSGKAPLFLPKEVVARITAAEQAAGCYSEFAGSHLASVLIGRAVAEDCDDLHSLLFGMTGGATEGQEAALQALVTQWKEAGIPEDGDEDLPDVQSELLPLFVNQHTANFVVACCKAADVAPVDFVEDWIGGMVDMSVDDEGRDVFFAGITADLLNEFGPEETDFQRSAEDNEEIAVNLRKIVAREKERRVAEPKQEAAASKEGGAA